VDAAEEKFSAGGVTYPAGSWIVEATRETVDEAARKTGLTFAAAAALPEVRRHVVDLPRLAVLHNWIDTQDVGWVRYTFDRAKIPYTYINDDDLKRGGLAERFDIILFPASGGDFAGLVHGIDPKVGPLAYTQTPEFPSHGVPDASDDVTGGMGFQGLLNLQRFLEAGGVLVTLGNAGTLAVEGGLVRNASRVPPSGFNTPGSELRARILRARHPIAYGYEELTSVFRGNGPIFDVPKHLRSRIVMQFGTKKQEDEDEAKKEERRPKEGEIEVEDLDDSAAPAAETKDQGKDKDQKEDNRLVLSGFVKGEDAVNGKPAILDLPAASAGAGRVILFAFNPLHRFLNLSDFRLVYNVILNWNDLPQ
jgi:hypothetical protein